MSVFDTVDVWWAIAMIAVWFVWLCLRTIARDLEHTSALRELSAKAKALRESQNERLRALRGERADGSTMTAHRSREAA